MKTRSVMTAVKYLFAAIVAAAVLLPIDSAVAMKGDFSRNFSPDKKHRQVINPNDAAAVQACKDDGGTVEKLDGKTVCELPVAKSK